MPAWERIDASARAAFNELFHAPAAAQQGFQQPGKVIALVAGEPGFGDFAKDAVHNLFREVMDALNPGSEIGEPADMLIDDGTEEEAEQGRVVKLPIWPIKEIAMVHHLGDETDLQRVAGRLGAPIGEPGAEEDGLAGVRVAGPLIERQYAKEVFRVGDLLHQRIGKDVVNRLRDGIAREAGAEMPARSDFAAGGAELNINFGELAEEFRRDFDDAGFRLGDIEVGEQNGGDVLIDKDAAVLGIVGEFDDVMMAIGGFHEEGLGAATHAAQWSSGENGHLSLV